jgi:hypothetical protein
VLPRDGKVQLRRPRFAEQEGGREDGNETGEVDFSAVEDLNRGREATRRFGLRWVALIVLAYVIYAAVRWYTFDAFRAALPRSHDWDRLPTIVVLVWLAVFVVLIVARIRHAGRWVPVTLITGWASLATLSIALLAASPYADPVVTIEGDPALAGQATVPFCSAVSPSECDDPSSHWRAYETAAVGQEFLWHGFAVQLADARVVDQLDGLPSPGPAIKSSFSDLSRVPGRYLVLTFTVTKRGDYRADFAGDMLLAVGAATGEPSTEQFSGPVGIWDGASWRGVPSGEGEARNWLCNGTSCPPYPYDHLTSHLPVPATIGETVTVRMAVLVPPGEQLFAVVDTGARFACRRDRLFDDTASCRRLLFVWTIPSDAAPAPAL